MRPPEERFATVGDVELCYETFGEPGRPAVLLIMGLGAQMIAWHVDFCERLAERGFFVVRYDNRDAGLSTSVDGGPPPDPMAVYLGDPWSVAYTLEDMADDGAALLDALGIERALVHGTSMGGMVAIAFTAKYPEKTIAACADCSLARCDVHRRTLFRTWRNMAESMPLDEVSDAITIQAVGASFIESEAGKDVFANVRAIVGKNSLHTIRQACIAMEEMDLEALARQIRRPILFTNGTHDIMTPPRLAPSGFSAADIVAAVPEYARLHEFPDIGHADLLEAPDEALRIVTAFFQEVLASEGTARSSAGAAP